MLISMLKLMNGDEIIAKIVDHDSEHYLLEDPVQMYKNVAPNGMTWIQCSHWLLYSESSMVEIEKRNVIAMISDLNKDVLKNYHEFIELGWEEHMKVMQIKQEEQERRIQKATDDQIRRIFGDTSDKETIH